MRPDTVKRGLLLGACAFVAGCGISDWVTEKRQGLHFFVVNDRLHLRGTVIKRTPAAFADVLVQNPQLRVVVLQDMRGLHDAEAVRTMGYALRKRGFGTALQSDSSVRGAAVDLFLSGAQRTMVAGAELGLVMPEADVARRKYLQDMLGSDRFYEFALQAGAAGGIYVLTEDEITRQVVLTAPIERMN